MSILNNNRKKLLSTHYIHLTTAVTTFTLAIIFASSSMTATPVEATTTQAASTTTTTTTAATTLSSSYGIELSPQPIYEERSPEPDIIPINQTYATLTFSGNGILTLPNTTQTINTSSNGTGVISFTTSSGYAKETITTENGETATATFYEIVQFNPAVPGEGKGIVTAVFQTNSTGMLAPLNGMIAAGIDDMSSTGESHVTLWRWESGIVISNSTVPSALMQDESPINKNNTKTASELP